MHLVYILGTKVYSNFLQTITKADNELHMYNLIHYHHILIKVTELV